MQDNVPPQLQQSQEPPLPAQNTPPQNSLSSLHDIRREAFRDKMRTQLLIDRMTISPTFFSSPVSKLYSSAYNPNHSQVNRFNPQLSKYNYYKAYRHEQVCSQLPAKDQILVNSVSRITLPQSLTHNLGADKTAQASETKQSLLKEVIKRLDRLEQQLQMLSESRPTRLSKRIQCKI